MAEQDFDPGLTRRFSGSLRRVINKDGSFNVRRRGGRRHVYLTLISIGWARFFAVAIGAFLCTNLVFALLYAAVGTENLQGGDPGLGSFANAFFFSTQTLTTVGYGHISPRGIAASTLAALEGMMGVMGFAVLTGLLYGRVSRPSAQFVFSRNMLVAPYGDGMSLQFRIANSRRNILMDLEANAILMTVRSENGELLRKYEELKLERSVIYFLPLTWTIVHPIDESSPFRNRTPESLASAEAEIIVLVRAFDDTFSQTVHARQSYRHEEIVWNARFDQAFRFDRNGDMVLDLGSIDAVR
jgi:inward rectifier potassium channel